jgi:hypothetical protein
VRHEIDAAVRNRTGLYCEAVSGFDLDLFADCWMADARWEVPGAAPTVGREAIVGLFASIRAGYRLCVQELLSGVVEPDDDGTAIARWHIRELQWRNDGEGRQLIGIYTDRLVPDGGVLRFASRHFEPLYRGGADLGGRLYRPAAGTTTPV